MKRTKIHLDLDQFPDDISCLMRGADTYDSSCSKEAKVYFIDKEIGFFMKEAAATAADSGGYFLSRKIV